MSRIPKTKLVEKARYMYRVRLTWCQLTSSSQSVDSMSQEGRDDQVIVW